MYTPIGGLLAQCKDFVTHLFISQTYSSAVSASPSGNGSVKLLASGQAPQPPPPFADAGLVFDPPLPQPKLLASGREPQPPTQWEVGGGEAFDPPLVGLRYLANGRLPRALPSCDPQVDESIEFDPPIDVLDDEEDETCYGFLPSEPMKGDPHFTTAAPRYRCQRPRCQRLHLRK
jgi:hypothetical protein